MHQDEYFRSKSCKLLVLPSENICKNCHAEKIKFKGEVDFKKSALTAPAKLNAPVNSASPDRIRLTLQKKRLECKQLERETSNMRKALDSDSKKVNYKLSLDFQKLFSQYNEKEVPSFMKLFWEEQQNYISSSSPTSIRYHPMIIKFCLSLAGKSPSAYKDLRYGSTTGTGILVLPGLRTLRDYKNYIRPTRGFNPEVINELAKKTVSFSEIE